MARTPKMSRRPHQCRRACSRAAVRIVAAGVACSVARGALGTPPELSLYGDVSVQLELGAALSWVDPGAVCVDAEDLNPNLILPTVALREGWQYLEYKCVVTSANPDAIVSATVLRHVVVTDTTPPTLTLSAPNPQNISQGSVWAEPGVSCDDTERVVVQWEGTAVLSVDMYYNGEVHTTPNGIDTSLTGVYLIKYTCMDPARNVARSVRTVNVIDSIAPVLSLRGLPVVLLHVGDTWQDPGCDCLDAQDGRIRVTTAGGLPATRLKAVGIYLVTYRCKDFAGNVAIAVHRTVQVAAAARAWRVAPIGAVSSDWKVRGISFFDDMDCSPGHQLKVMPQRAGRRWPNGAGFSTPRGRTSRADAGFAHWTPSGYSWGLGWNAGICGADDDPPCHIGFAFEDPVMINCVTLEQSTEVGSFAAGLRLQWCEFPEACLGSLANLTPNVFKDFVRIDRGLVGGAVQLRRTCPLECMSCGGAALTVHPCSAT